MTAPRLASRWRQILFLWLAGCLSLSAQEKPVALSPVGSGVPQRFRFPADQAAPSAPADERYLKVTYLDRGYGRLAVRCRSATGKWIAPDKATMLTLLDTDKATASFLRFPGPFAADFEVQIGLEKSGKEPLKVYEALAQGKPFDDPHLRYLIDEPWKRAYAGTSVAGIDNSTLQGRVMVGYQGWFRTPNDPYDSGWRHWGDMYKNMFDVDMWPDVSQYPASGLDKASDVKTRSGKTAYLFSSGWPEVVRQHFSWMRQHDIDGAFVQRFISQPQRIYSLGGGPEWVLGNVRAAANEEGRIWAVEYDVSGCPDDRLLQTIRTDWKWLVDDFGVRSDKSYAREGDKPVVFVWGMSLPTRHISPQTADAVIEFLKNDPVYGGNYVIGGMPGNWQTLDPVWQQHIAKYDAALAWHSTQYAEDLAALQKLGVVYYAMAWPGFSWANLKHLPTASTEAFSPREGGAFYEAQLSKAAAAKVDHLFVGMFDECDEGTAILPMSDDPPLPNSRPGTSAKFFPNLQLEGNPSEVLIPAVDLDLERPPAKGLQPQNYSIRCQGQLAVPKTGAWTLSAGAAPGDKVDLWVGDKHAATGPLNVSLTEGQPVIYRLECRHASSAGRLQLRWEGPGVPAETAPPSAFTDAWGRFITNDGKPSDWWLTLTGRWRKAMRPN